MTYGMYVSLTVPRAGRASEIGKFLKKAHWNIVMADEVHHSTAATYKPALEELKNNSQQIMGFTGTLFSSFSEARATAQAMSRERRTKSACLAGLGLSFFAARVGNSRIVDSSQRYAAERF